MGLFSKSEYKDYMMSFKVIEPDKDMNEAMGVQLVAYENINGEDFYYSAIFNFNSGKITYEEYCELIAKLLNYDNKKIKVKVKLKNNKVKKFKIDIASIATAYNEDRLNTLELLGYGLYNSWPIT